MAIKIEFDTNHNAIEPTFVLANRAGDKLGQITTAVNFNLTDNMNSACEFTVDVYKQFDGVRCNLWDAIVDFKLVWCKEWDKWFQIAVQLDEDSATIKRITATSLGQAQLSQIMLYNIEINTQDDIARQDYTKPTILYDPSDPSVSLLDRILGKAPHYHIAHVDYTIADIQRTFSFNGKSIYDAMQQIAAQINCIFVFESGSNEDGSINRSISAYDLESYCTDCKHRGEFIDKCPECGGTNVVHGYGQDTTIFVSTQNLADNISFTTDTGSVKNCFRLVGGDDLMTATITNCNPNGSSYLWYISDAVKQDMPDTLVQKLDSYDQLYSDYQTTHEIIVSSDILDDYNSLVDKYYDAESDELSIKTITSPIVGYPSLMQGLYEAIDFYYYLNTSMMPSPTMSDTSAEQESQKLTTQSLSPVSVTDVSIVSLATANSAVLAVAKCLIDPRYQVKIGTSSLQSQTWTGNFVITNYSDDQDTATTSDIEVTISDDYEVYLKQMIEKALNKEDKTQDFSIAGIFEKDLNAFKLELKKYSLDSLGRFNDACQSCLDVLIDQGVADKSSYAGLSPDLYTQMYYPYFQKKQAIESQVKLRTSQVDTVNALIEQLQQLRAQIQDTLDFEKYLGQELWLIFSAYRRQDTYTNDNYISDGLNNAELFDMARKFIEVAQKEIYKSAQLQHSISASLYNLLVMKEFEPLCDHFAVGNWLRIRVDDKVYRLRLLSYSIDYSNLATLNVTFSDVTKTLNGVSDSKSVMEQAASMATSYGSVSRQAQNGDESRKQIKNWYNDGMSLTHMAIVNDSDNQSLTVDSHGMLMKEYLPITDEYSKEQLKVINKGLYVTDDGWQTSRAGIGHFKYYDPQTGQIKDGYGVIADTLIGSLILSEKVGIYNKQGSIKLDQNGILIDSFADKGDKQTLFKIRRNYTDVSGKPQTKDIFYIDSDGYLVLNGSVKISSSGSSTDEPTIDDVVDKVNNSVSHIAVQYYLSTSNEILQGGQWSAIAPTWVQGKYMWQRTVTYYADGEVQTGQPTCISGASGQNGTDAVVLRIDSSRGTVFKNNNVTTVLSVTIFSGSRCITNKQGLKNEFGNGAYLQWKWKRMDDDSFGTISSSDPRIQNDGFEFHLSPNDVDTKVTFQCDLNV